MQLYLASRSPRRVELLAQMGLTCQTCPADIDEAVKLNEPPVVYVKRVAHEKALAAVTQNLTVFNRHIAEQTNAILLAADTTVAVNGEILGKSIDDADAINMLKKLSGQTHEVHTAVAGMLISAQGIGEATQLLSTTMVAMRVLTPADINQYIASGEHKDKAGSYGIQGLAATYISHINGSYSGVMGLPVYETAAMLRGFGLAI